MFNYKRIYNGSEVQPSQLQILGVHVQIIYMFLWKLNPSDRTIALTKLLIKHAKLQTKEIELEHNTNLY